MSRPRAWLLRTLMLLACGLAPAARAHDVGISQALLEELPGGRYLLAVEPGMAPADAFAPPRPPARCALEPLAGAARAVTPGLRYAFTCPPPGLTLDDVLHLPWQRQGVMLAARWQDGTAARRLFANSGGGAGIVVPLAALAAGSGSLAEAAGRYLTLGVEHILLGTDHLLFVLGLLLIVRGPWPLLKTITAFTLAHSLTLGLATFELLTLPPAPVDAAIALSIVFLAVEILRAGQGRTGLTHRLPWLVAFGFGLLHGLGFAGALAEVGLPAREIPTALLFFNLGVEAGQLLFVAVVLNLRWALTRLPLPRPAWAGTVPAYAIGTLATFWFLQRLTALAAAG